MEEQVKDRQLRHYELMEYFGGISRVTEPQKAGDIIIHNIAEKCPAYYLDDIDAYMCGKLLGIVEVCLEALQSIPNDRATPFQVKAALSHIGQYLTDITDPRLQELKELIDANKP